LPNLEEHEADVLAPAPHPRFPTHEIIIPLANTWKRIPNSLIV